MRKIKEAPEMGAYKKTSLDARKEQVDFLVKDISVKSACRIVWRCGKAEQVTSRQLKSLQKNHSWTTDF